MYKNIADVPERALAGRAWELLGACALQKVCLHAHASYGLCGHDYCRAQHQDCMYHRLAWIH